MKRVPSRVAALRRLIDEEIRAELISEPLFVVDVMAAAADVVAQLDLRGFDECGVERDGHIGEFVRRADLTDGRVGGRAGPVPLDRVVAPATPLWGCLPRLVSNGPLYVLGDRGLAGIATRADLNKQPARLLMFGVISMLEMALGEIIRDAFPSGGWEVHITNERREKAEKLQGDRRKLKQELDLVECLQFCDKRGICGAVPEIAAALRLTSGAKDALKHLQGLRDDLAHAQELPPPGGWQQVIDALRAGHDVFDRAVGYLDDRTNAGQTA